MYTVSMSLRSKYSPNSWRHYIKIAWGGSGVGQSMVCPPPFQCRVVLYKYDDCTAELSDKIRNFSKHSPEKALPPPCFYFRHHHERGVRGRYFFQDQVGVESVIWSVIRAYLHDLRGVMTSDGGD